MTKLYEVKTPQQWVDINSLIDTKLTGVIELFNAGREGSTDILWTESAEQPLKGAFYKLIKRQESVVFAVGAQPIWIKSEGQIAKLIISSLNAGELVSMVEELKHRASPEQYAVISSSDAEHLGQTTVILSMLEACTSYYLLNQDTLDAVQITVNGITLEVPKAPENGASNSGIVPFKKNKFDTLQIDCGLSAKWQLEIYYD